MDVSARAHMHASMLYLRSDWTDVFKFGVRRMVGDLLDKSFQRIKIVVLCRCALTQPFPVSLFSLYYLSSIADKGILLVVRLMNIQVLPFQ